METRNPLETRLEAVRQYYFDHYNGDPAVLRKAIPANEVWRFFVERIMQRHGRQLERFLSEAYKIENIAKDYMHKSLKENAEMIDSTSIQSQKDWEKSRLAKLLAARYWQFKKEEWQTLTVVELIELDCGWLPFEINEKHYFDAVLQGFNEIFNLKQELGIDLLLKLHGLATADVENLHQVDAGNSGKFRAMPVVCFALQFGSVFSADGLYEYIEENDEEDHHIDFQFYQEGAKDVGLEVGSIRINKDCLRLIRDYYKNPAKYAGKEPPFAKYIDEEDRGNLLFLIKSDKRITAVFEAIASEDDVKGLKFIFNLVKHQAKLYGLLFTSKQKFKSTVQIRQYFADKTQKYINEYNDAIAREKNPLKQLKILATLIQNEELLHPFPDANGRTICMLLVNFLLMKNGFPPAILNDSNRFNIFSKDEMIKELIKGMENTLYLARHRELFRFKTEDLYQGLTLSGLIKDKMEYMNQLFEREEQFRQQQDLSLNK